MRSLVSVIALVFSMEAFSMVIGKVDIQQFFSALSREKK